MTNNRITAQGIIFFPFLFVLISSLPRHMSKQEISSIFFITNPKISQTHKVFTSLPTLTQDLNLIWKSNQNA